MRMEQLKYLVDVAETKSMSKTAERLFVTQQAVSNSLKNLKDELNIELFLRSGQGLDLTKEGEITLNFARLVIDAKKDLEQQLEQMKVCNSIDEEMVVQIASASKILNSLIPKITSAQYNGKMERIVVYETDFDNLFLHLKYDDAQLGLLTINKTEYEERRKYYFAEDYCADILKKDKLLMVLHAKYFRELCNATGLRLEELLDQKSNMKTQYVQTAFGHIGTSQFQHLLHENPSFHRVNDLEFCRNLLLEEKAIVYMPELAYKMFFGSKKYMHNEINSDATEVLHLAIYKKKNHTQVRNIIDLLKMEIQKIK